MLPLHYATTMLLWKYCEYVPTKSLKLQCKKTTRKKEEIMRLHSDS